MKLLPKDTIKVSADGSKWVDPTEESAATAKYIMLENGGFKRRRRECTHPKDWQSVTQAHIKAHGGS